MENNKNIKVDKKPDIIFKKDEDKKAKNEIIIENQDNKSNKKK